MNNTTAPSARFFPWPPKTSEGNGYDLQNRPPQYVSASEKKLFASQVLNAANYLTKITEMCDLYPFKRFAQCATFYLNTPVCNQPDQQKNFPSLGSFRSALTSAITRLNHCINNSHCQQILIKASEARNKLQNVLNKLPQDISNASFWDSEFDRY